MMQESSHQSPSRLGSDGCTFQSNTYKWEMLQKITESPLRNCRLEANQYNPFRGKFPIDIIGRDFYTKIQFCRKQKKGEKSNLNPLLGKRRLDYNFWLEQFFIPVFSCCLVCVCLFYKYSKI